ncbi:MAG: FtsX-like permease family protein, partial [Acidobacteriota bacterium]
EAWAFPPDGILAKRRLLENPKVAGVTLASNVISLSNRDPLDEMGEKIEVLRDSAWEPLTGGIFVLACDHDFVPVFHLRLLAGRNFSGTRDESSSAIINETLARRLGPGDPVGKTVRIRNRDLTVIGILGDFNIQPLHASIGPVLLTHTNDNYGLLYARFGAGVADEALSIVEKAIDEFIPDEKNSAVFLEDRLSALYKAERKQAALMSFFATLSVIIAGLSVFGLAGFAVERRTREIGIRKVLGARTGRLFLLLSGNFTVLLGVANALGWPLAFYFANRWLSNFAYHVPVRPGAFLLTAAGMMGVMLLASGTQIAKIARIDPVEILKYE